MPLNQNTPFLEEDSPQSSPKNPQPVRRKRAANHGFLGMTPAQRFVLAILFFFLVCASGSFILILAGKFVLPF